MPFSRATLAALINRVKADVQAELQNGAVYVRRTLENAMAKAVGGVASTLHGHISWAARQIIFDTAEEAFLVRWANLFGQGRNPAVQASFDVIFSGTVANTPIPAGTQVTREDGEVFETLALVNLPAVAPFEVTAEVRALVAGAAGNTLPGTALSLASPIPGVNSSVIVDGAGTELVGNGSDIESVEALRERFIEYVQDPPKGGATGDYKKWAKEASSEVSRAWEIPGQLGPSTILVLYVQDTYDDEGNYVDTIFPVDTSTVADYIDTKKPITDIVTVDAPIEALLNPTIQLEPNDATTQEQVTLYLQEYLLRRSEPGGTLLLSEINEAISLAPDEEDHVLVSPAANVTAAATTLYTLGTITFQDIP